MTPAGEPTPERLRQPWRRYFAATRPAFLSLTLVAYLLGLACALHDGQAIDILTAFLGGALALVIHAGANVINDWHDAANDAANDQRLFPYTGGSRMIQNGVLSERQMALLGYGLLLFSLPAGAWLAWSVAPGLWAIGATGLLLAWAYSAPPLRLQARALGEPAVAAAWLLVVLGSDFMQRQSLVSTPLLAGLSFALLVANVLYIAQFPDAPADARAGKRTLVVRLGAHRARAGYPLLAFLAYGSTALAIAAGQLPLLAAFAFLSAWASLLASRALWRGQPLAPAIRLTIAAAASYGLLLAGALVLSRP